jgi:hypothetical protein
VRTSNIGPLDPWTVGAVPLSPSFHLFIPVTVDVGDYNTTAGKSGQMSSQAPPDVGVHDVEAAGLHIEEI